MSPYFLSPFHEKGPLDLLPDTWKRVSGHKKTELYQTAPLFYALMDVRNERTATDSSPRT